ncbi:ArpU family transcriptional regulator, partial [Streptococcus pyogenes]
YTELCMSESFYYDTLDIALLAFAELYREGVLLAEKGVFS